MSMLYHLGAKTLESARLILRPFNDADADAIFQNWASDPEVTRYLTWPTHQKKDITKAVLAGWVDNYKRKDYYQWAIVSKEHSNTPIGSIAVVDFNEEIQKAQVGYCLGRNWWHRGIMSEALDAVIRFLILDVGFRRVEAYHDSRNIYSGAVMRKCGMQYEGMLRASARNNQGICDACWYSILAEDLEKEV